MKEADVQKWVREYLCEHYKHHCVYLKYQAGQYATRGVSDLIFCVRGLYIAIEVKMPKGKPTKLQERFLTQVKKAGGLGYIIYGKDQEMISDIIKDINERTS